MARLLFPDEGSRLVYRVVGGTFRPVLSGFVTFYTNSAATVLADIREYDGTLTPGPAITGSVVSTDEWSRVPFFWGPDGEVDTLYAVVSGGPTSPVFARFDPRVDSLDAAVTALEAGGGPYDPAGAAAAAQAAAIAAASADATTKANAAIATASADATTKANAAQAAAIAAASTDATTKANAAQAAAISAASTDATTKANAAQAAAIAASLQKAQNLADLPSASTARTNLGLGTAAVQNVGAFDAAGSAAAAQAASQPLDSDLTAIAALTTTPFGRAFLTMANAGAAGAAIGLYTPRVTPIVSSATPAVNTDVTDVVNITALAVDVTSMTTSLTGTPPESARLIFKIKDDGVARAITWGAKFVAGTVALPTTTTASKIQYVGFIYDTNTATWQCVGNGVNP